METITKMINAFEQAASKYSEATEVGNARVANRNFDKVEKIVLYLKENNSLDELRMFLNHDVIGVRMLAASYLLPKYEKEASSILEEISNQKGMIPFIAEMTLKEWRKGNLRD